jgi:hypothetical protein
MSLVGSNLKTSFCTTQLNGERPHFPKRGPYSTLESIHDEGALSSFFPFCSAGD